MKNLIFVATLTFVVGCESMRSDNDSEISTRQSPGINDPSGTQSFSSDPNQSSSSGNVGQSGNILPSATEPYDSDTVTNSAPQNNSPQ